MENRKKIEDILTTSYGCFDDFTVDKLLDFIGAVASASFDEGFKISTEKFNAEFRDDYGLFDSDDQKLYEQSRTFAVQKNLR